MFKGLMKALGYVKDTDIFVEVKNKDKYKSANKKYYLVKADGKSYLFTDNNLKIARYRAMRNPEDLK